MSNNKSTYFRWDRLVPFRFLLIIFFISSIISCGRAAQVEIEKVIVSNNIAVANAGSDQNVTTLSRVTLDGSESYDLDNDLLIYRWRMDNRPNLSDAEMTDISRVNPSFIADKEGSYVISLIVSDGTGESDKDFVTIVSTQANSRPMANAGSNQRAVTGTDVSLDASASSDADGNTLTYRWSWIEKPVKSLSTLNDREVVNPRFFADIAGNYVLGLIVSDGTLTSEVARVNIVVTIANSAPTANAGADQNVETQSEVMLDASDSFDVNNDILTYNWRFVSKAPSSNATLSNAASVNPTFTPDVDGSYVLDLMVSDVFIANSSDRIIISSYTANSPPTAIAGMDQRVETNSIARLDGSASNDVDKNILFYRWSIVSKPQNSDANLIDPARVDPTLTPDVDGSYVVNLVVNDGTLSSASDQITITSLTTNVPPTASAGDDQNVATNTLVTLDASGSFDVNQDTLSYAWSFVSKAEGSRVLLDRSNVIMPKFTPDFDGSYVLSVVVNDGALNSQIDRVIITSTTENSPPIAVAGLDQRVATKTVVTLDGAASHDVNDDTLTFSWLLVSKPGGSVALIDQPNTIRPTFLADLDGVYQVSLVVNDGLIESLLDTVIIESFTANRPPIASAGPDQQQTTLMEVILDGSESEDLDGDTLTYRWSFEEVPASSNVVLDDTQSSGPKFTPDTVGGYRINLIVNDGQLDSDSVSVFIEVSKPATITIDNFDGTGPLVDYTTNNELSLPDISRIDGRYYANLVDNTDDITLHYHSFQGRLDAKRVNFPFEVIARNIGIGTFSVSKDMSQIPPVPSLSSYIFAGIQVHVENLDDRYSSHVVVGHRGDIIYTVEGKNTVDSISTVTDEGVSVVPDGRADIRIVGNADYTLTVYWQVPNLQTTTQDDKWQLYNNDGKLPGISPDFSATVYVGLITYAQGESDVPFVGTCDSIQYTEF